MVEGFTGLPGSGKTYWLTKIATERRKKEPDLPIWANFHLGISDTNYFQNLSEVFGVRKGLILVDEINLVCPSRWWNKFPPQLAYFWSQTRKFGLDIYWTSQHIDRVDKIIREISNYVWWIKTLPFGIRNARQYIPEHINKEKRQCFRSKWFKISKKIYKNFNTFEAIEISL